MSSLAKVLEMRKWKKKEGNANALFPNGRRSGNGAGKRHFTKWCNILSHLLQYIKKNISHTIFPSLAG